MSGVYKLVNLFLFVAFSGLLGLLTHRITSVQPQFIAPGTSSGEEAGAEAEPTPAPLASSTAKLASDFSSYGDVVNLNLFSVERKPWDDTVPAEPTPEPTPEEVVEEQPMEMPVGLQLTGIMLIGATKVAFFDESNVQSSGMGAGLPQQGPGGAGRLQQRLLEQQRQMQAAKMQSAMQGKTMPPAGLAAQPGMQGQMGEGESGESTEKVIPKLPKRGYRVGEEIQGMKVEDIGKTQVVLSKDGLKGVLELSKETRIISGGPQRQQVQPPQMTNPSGMTPQQQLQQQQRAQDAQRRLAERQRRLAEQQERRRPRRRQPVEPDPAEEFYEDEESYFPEDEENLNSKEMADEEEYIDEEVDPMSVPQKRPRKRARNSDDE